MKRTATLLAGLLLVTGTTFAAGQSNWDFTGTEVNAQTNISDSTYEPINDQSNKDTDLKFQFNYQVNDRTKISLGYDTNDEKGSLSDTLGEVLVNRKDGRMEAQFDAELNINNTLLPFIFEDADSDKTYARYNHTNNLALTFYPFNMGMKNAKEFDDCGIFTEYKGDYYTEIPGVVLSVGKSYVGIGIDEVEYYKDKNKDGTPETEAIAMLMGIKAGTEFSTRSAEFILKYSGTFIGDDLKNGYAKNGNNYVKATAEQGNGIVKDVVVGTGGNLGLITNDINVQAKFYVNNKVTIDGELGVETLAEDLYLEADGQDKPTKVSTGFGLFVKGSYELSNIVTPYVKFKYTSDGYLGSKEILELLQLEEADLINTSSGEVKRVNRGNKIGGLTELAFGTDYKMTERFTLNGEARIIKTGEKLFKDASAEDDDDAYKNSAFLVSASAKYTF